MVYILRAGPPLEVSQLDSTMPSFSICRSVRYSVPGFIASKPKAEARSINSYPYEFHSLKESRVTGTSQFRGRASTPRKPRSRPSTPRSCASSLMILSSILYMHSTYMYWHVKGEIRHSAESRVGGRVLVDSRSPSKVTFTRSSCVTLLSPHIL